MTSSPSTAGSRRSSSLARALVQPVNVLVPVGVLVAGALLSVPWLAFVAVACWLALVGLAYFDQPSALTDPALAPEIAARVAAARNARQAIRAAVRESRSPLDDVTREVDQLVAAIETDAARAKRIQEFLAGERSGELERRIAAEPNPTVREALEAKESAVARLRQRLYRLLAEMDHVVTTLETVQAEILATDGIEEQTLASQVIDLRTNVQLASEGLEEAFAETRVRVRT
jgi:hypothetical protein